MSDDARIAALESRIATLEAKVSGQSPASVSGLVCPSEPTRLPFYAGSSVPKAGDQPRCGCRS